MVLVLVAVSAESIGQFGFWYLTKTKIMVWVWDFHRFIWDWLKQTIKKQFSSSLFVNDGLIDWSDSFVRPFAGSEFRFLADGLYVRNKFNDLDWYVLWRQTTSMLRSSCCFVVSITRVPSFCNRVLFLFSLLTSSRKRLMAVAGDGFFIHSFVRSFIRSFIRSFLWWIGSFDSFDSMVVSRLPRQKSNVDRWSGRYQ